MDSRKQVTRKKNVPDDIRARHQMRQKKKRRARVIFRTTFILLILSCGCAALMFLTPWFNISSVEVVGNNVVSSESITLASGILEGENTFKISTDLAKRHIGVLPYIKFVDVRRKLPSGIIIEVSESHMVASVQSTGCYVGMDEDGKALEISSGPIEGYPSIIGLSVSEFSPGKAIKFDSDSTKNSVIYYLDELQKYELINDITSLDFTNMLDIKMKYKGRITVFVGDGSNIGRKILTLIEVVKNQLSDQVAGEIDLRIEGKAYYRP